MKKHLATACLTLATALVAAQAPKPTPPAVPAPTSAPAAASTVVQIGERVPPVSGKTWDGKSVSLEDYKGKVVLIDFWATWCRPCVNEMPNVRAAYSKYHDKGFEILGVSLDNSAAPLQKWYSNPATTTAWPSVFEGKGWGSENAKRFHVISIPATYLVDREGVLLATGLRGPALEKAVAKALGVEAQIGPDLEQLFALMETADAARLKELEPKVIEAARLEADELNQVILNYVEKPQPRPEVARIALKALGDAVDKARDPKAIDIAAMAAYWSGDPARAEMLQKLALDVLTTSLNSPDPARVETHPGVVIMRDKLALWIAAQGRLDEARALEQQVRAGASTSEETEQYLEAYRYDQLLREKLQAGAKKP